MLYCGPVGIPLGKCLGLGLRAERSLFRVRVDSGRADLGAPLLDVLADLVA